jgi:hypothetical protein
MRRALSDEVVDLLERLHRDHDRLLDALIELDRDHGRDALEALSYRIGDHGGTSDLVNWYVREFNGGDGGLHWTIPPRPLPPDPDEGETA